MPNTESLAEQLEAVLAGALELDTVLENPSNFSGSNAGAFHGLWHFLADADIRAKDPAYRAMQEREMLRLIALLKSGANEQSLAKVSFLGRTHE